MIKKSEFDICYNYKLKSPLLTKHTSIRGDLKKEGFDRSGVSFYEEKTVPTRYRARLSDFRGSGFDRGHMVANDDFNHNRKLQKETFTLANITAQAPKANRGIIKYTEKLIRKLTISNGKSIVLTGAIFDRINPKRIGPGQVAIPSHIYKIVYLPNKNPIAFLIPNKNEKMGSKPSRFKTSVSTLERLTGFKFNYKIY